ncbi:hypothetical protein AIIKEEIJ_02573 [Rhodococcus sp. YH1]|nr:hypothetical protein [Rhodococcus sp. YH1]
MPTTSSGDRRATSATRSSGPTPRAIRCRARRWTRAPNSPYVTATPSYTSATAPGSRRTCSSNRSTSVAAVPVSWTVSFHAVRTSCCSRASSNGWSPTGTSGACTSARSNCWKRSATARAVDSSNRSVANVRIASIPDGAPCSSYRSLTIRCRSNCDVPPSRSIGATVRPASSSSVRCWFWNEKPTWNSGCRAVERAGLSTSTSRSNGTSACANACRSVSRAAASSSSNERPPSTESRKTSVLTNMPIRFSTAASPRPAMGVPTAMSADPDRRASSVANAACIAMNTVALRARARSRNAACTSASTVNSTRSPRNDCCAGRGRSVGRSSWSGRSASAVRQWSSCRAASDSGSSSEPSSSRCHSA